MPFKPPQHRDDDSLTTARQQATTSRDKDLSFDLGHFLLWFASAELALSTLLAVSTKSRDLRAFDILCERMDAGGKLDRFRKVAKGGMGIGPNLESRLNKFAVAIKLRNKIAHSAIAHSEKIQGVYLLCSLSKLPFQDFNLDIGISTDEPYEIRSLDLFAWAEWLQHLSYDLKQAVEKSIRGEQPEIDKPRTQIS